MTRRPHRRRHRSIFETLEQRHLLTVVGPDVLWWPEEQFTVRRDEAEPVELHVYFGHNTRFVAEPDDPSGEVGEPRVSVIDSGSGSVSIARDGNTILYQPAEGFLGIDVITVSPNEDPTLSVNGDEFAPETKRIAINVVEPLLAVPDWYQVPPDADGAILDVLRNDTRNARYIGAEPKLILQSAEVIGDGSVALNDDRTAIQFTPAVGAEGVQTINYVAVDADGYTASGTAQVRIVSERSETLWPEQLQQLMVENAVTQLQYSFGVAAHHFDGRYYLDGPVALGLGPENDTSGTNNQITDVDESDRIKTDGEFLYVLSSPDRNDWYGWDIFPWIGRPNSFAPIPEPTDGNMLTVIDIRQPAEPMIVSRQLFDDKVLSLDLQGDRLTVISQRDRSTVVTSLDISDPESVQNVWTTVVDGNFKQARRVDGALYVFTDDYGLRVPPLESICTDGDEFCFYETGSVYLDRVSDTLLESYFPSQQVFDADGNRVDDVPTLFVDPLAVGLPDYSRRLNIITFDTASSIGGAIDWDITSANEHVLVTRESIFVTRTDYNSGHFFEDDVDVFIGIPERPTISTEIQRFVINADGTIDHSASGAVPGVLNNSFSLDEHNGLLRIATENSWWNASPEDDGSNIYVLQQTDAVYDVIGGVQGLAPGEQIYAVRFAGDRGYVVTFRRVDPLFVVDLSEPTAPVVLGQLKAPGYSQYLHIIDENHLIGIGRDADEDTGLYEGLIVSLFNVSDPTNPLVQDRYEFDGGRTTFSPFAEDNPWDLRDHHAISYFRETGILALPVYSQNHHWTDEENKPIFESSDQSAVRTLRIDTDAGISELDWITFDDSRADRTLRAGEHLYSLSNKELKVTRLLEPDDVIATLRFERDGQDDFVDTNVGDAVTIRVTDNDVIGDDDLEVLAATLVDGTGTVDIIDGKEIRFTPADNNLTANRIRYTARNAAGTLIDAIATVDPDLAWQNERSSLDVNNDDKTSARDALNIINWLKIYGTVDSEEIERAIGNADNIIERFFFDTTGDKKLSALDALLVINSLLEDAILASTDSSDHAPEAEWVTDQIDSVINDVAAVASFNAPVQAFAQSVDLVIADDTSDDEDNRAVDWTLF